MINDCKDGENNDDVCSKGGSLVSLERVALNNPTQIMHRFSAYDFWSNDITFGCMLLVVCFVLQSISLLNVNFYGTQVDLSLIYGSGYLYDTHLVYAKKDLKSYLQRALTL